MAMLAAVAPHLPIWGVIAVWAYIAYMLYSGARTEERRRREEGQPHTKRDNALLLLTGLCVVGVLLCGVFLQPLNGLINSRLVIAAVLLVVGGCLTYIFNRKRSESR